MSYTPLSFRDACLLEVACALLVHLIYNKYEFPPVDIFATLTLLVAIPFAPAYLIYLSRLIQPTWLSILISYFSFYTLLTTSIVLYRLSPIHPLAKYPGPKLARVSQLWAAVQAAGGKRHQYYKKLHDQYGPYVRVGPNELLCIDADVIPYVLGPDGLPKGPIWDTRKVPGRLASLISLRDQSEHLRRRKPWNRALNSSAVKQYEDALINRVKVLIDELDKRAVAKDTAIGREVETNFQVDLMQMMNYFAFDFMGEMAFGNSLNLLENGDKAGIWEFVESGLREIAVIQHVPWVYGILWKIPSLIAGRVKFVNFSSDLVKERMDRGSQKRDLLHHLLDEDHLETVRPSFQQIMSDAMLVVLAGSDTTATTLGSIFYYLLTHRDVYDRLHTEFEMTFPSGGEYYEANKLAEMPFLNAVINEGLRLSPPLPTSVQRATPRLGKGKWVGTRFLPAGTSINIPPYALHRCGSYFSPGPTVFWPDRWLKEESRQIPEQLKDALGVKTISEMPKVHTNTSAFIPFSFGPANCVGKNLATLEMRTVLALLITRFDFHLVSDYDLEDWNREQEDFFAMKNGRLPVVIRRRI